MSDTRRDSTYVDLTTDPLEWPLGEPPASDPELGLEYAVAVERMRREPESWQAKRWRLHELEDEPPPEFKRRLVTLFSYVYQPHVEGRPVPPNHYILQRIDEFVSAERSRAIRERLRLAHDQLPPTAGDATPTTLDSGNRGPLATPEQAAAAYAEHRSDRKAAQALGISRTQLRRLRGVEK